MRGDITTVRRDSAGETPANAATGVKTVSILGSTGSIGCSSVDLLAKNPDRFHVDALVAGKNWELLAAQAKSLGARRAVVFDESCYQNLKDALSGTGIEAQGGKSAVMEAAGGGADVVIAAIVGAAGLEPTIEAIKNGSTIGLANKECLVSAGDVVTREAQKHSATILPVDSEHSAIFQVFDFDNPQTVLDITLTASGGPFREKTLEEMRSVTPAQALRHPNWDMGAKISIDSATMFNKGLEIIEAYYLFPVAKEMIKVLVHPQSVVHSLVSYVDGSVLAQMGTPDMRTPIAYALAWPERMETPSEKLSLGHIGRLDFENPDETRFPALRLSREALLAGGSAPTLLNGANEIAVEAFLREMITFTDIADTVGHVLDSAGVFPLGSLGDVIDADRMARDMAREYISSLK